MIELYPDDKQKHILIQWFEIYRRVYNLVISNKKEYIENGLIYKQRALRNFIKKNSIPNHKDLVKDIKKYKIPAHTIDNAIFDVSKAFVSAMANKKAGNIPA